VKASPTRAQTSVAESYASTDEVSSHCGWNAGALLLTGSPSSAAWMQVYVSDGFARHHGQPAYSSQDGMYTLYFRGESGQEHGWWVGRSADGIGAEDVVAFLPYGHRQWCAVVGGVPQTVSVSVASVPETTPTKAASTEDMPVCKVSAQSPGEVAEVPILVSGSSQVTRVTNSRGDYWVAWFSRDLPPCDILGSNGQFQGGRSVWYSVGTYGADFAELLAKRHVEKASAPSFESPNAPKRRRLLTKVPAHRLFAVSPLTPKSREEMAARSTLRRPPWWQQTWQLCAASVSRRSRPERTRSFRRRSRHEAVAEDAAPLRPRGRKAELCVALAAAADRLLGAPAASQLMTLLLRRSHGLSWPR